MSEQRVLNLIEKQMNDAKSEMERILAQQMFAVDPILARIPLVPRRPWLMRWIRVREYFQTLWWALCGVALVKEDGEDYD